jgi:hypothetical protein
MFAAQKNRGKQFYWLLLTGFSLTIGAVGQGTFIYDQQSAIEGVIGESGGILQSNQPFGQSFTPTFSSINFIRLWLADGLPGNGLGATVFINLRTNSISGPILASTIPVSMPDGFGVGSRGYTNFFFPADISLSPGVTYFFQVVAASGGDLWSAGGDTSYHYAGGTMFINGAPPRFTDSDLWFREGIVVPEPSSFVLLIGSSAFCLVCRKQFKKRSSA